MRRSAPPTTGSATRACRARRTARDSIPEAFADFSDILGDFFDFGDLFGGGGGRRRTHRAQRGEDVRYDLEIASKRPFSA